MKDVLMFRVADLDVKELLLADERGVYFTTPHFKGYPAVLMRIPDLKRIDRDAKTISVSTPESLAKLEETLSSA